MNHEIETAYRVDTSLLPDLSSYPYKDIEQVYYTPAGVDPAYPETEGVEWRIRKTIKPTGSVTYTTAIKIGDKRSGERLEIDTELSADAFGTNTQEPESLSDVEQYGYGLVRKRRYDLGDDLVVDVLDPSLHGEGAVCAEKEFSSAEAQQSFEHPEWCIPADDIPANRELAVPLSPRSIAKTDQSGRPALAAECVVSDLRQAAGDKPLVVSVSGMSGSGKSTLAQYLAIQLDAAHIEADNLHIGATALQERFGYVNHDMVETYDYTLAGAAALALAHGNTATLPTYSFELAERTDETIHIKPTASRNVVVEGLYASEITTGNEQLSGQQEVITRHVLMDTPLYVSVVRRILRDTAGIRNSDSERKVAFTPEQSLAYLVGTAIPTYLKARYCNDFDYIVR